MISYEKVIYISHPYGGKKINEEETADIILKLYKEYPTYLFVSPIHAFSHEYNNVNYEDGLNKCLWLLDKCEECWVFGDYLTSKGCVKEIEYCKNNNIPYFIKQESSTSEMIKLYTINCPKCSILEEKLKDKNIKFEKITDIKKMESDRIDVNNTFFPILKINDKLLPFAEAIKFVNNYKE